jgi:hypothetical protein
VAVVEMAGRDSVAAALKAAREVGYRHLLPTYVYTGSEYGDWQTVPDAVACLAAGLPAETELHPLLVLGWPRLWQALCGRFVGELTHRLGLSTICPGCHLYLHMARAPLARALGNAPVIAGERESHDGRLKLNQLGVSLDAYQRAMAGLGLELTLPLRYLEQGGEITRILGDDWPEGGRQMACVLSGNYLDPEGNLSFEPAALSAYLDKFALPLATASLEAELQGREVDPVTLGARVLSQWSI